MCSTLTETSFMTYMAAIVLVALPSGYTGKTGARGAPAIDLENQECRHEQSRCQPGRLAGCGIRFRAGHGHFLSRQ